MQEKKLFSRRLRPTIVACSTHAELSLEMEKVVDRHIAGAELEREEWGENNELTDSSGSTHSLHVDKSHPVC